MCQDRSGTYCDEVHRAFPDHNAYPRPHVQVYARELAGKQQIAPWLSIEKTRSVAGNRAVIDHIIRDMTGMQRSLC